VLLAIKTSVHLLSHTPRTEDFVKNPRKNNIKIPSVLMSLLCIGRVLLRVNKQPFRDIRTEGQKPGNPMFCWVF
jgi:hypothetical protein